MKAIAAVLLLTLLAPSAFANPCEDSLLPMKREIARLVHARGKIEDSTLRSFLGANIRLKMDEFEAHTGRSLPAHEIRSLVEELELGELTQLADEKQAEATRREAERDDHIDWVVKPFVVKRDFTVRPSTLELGEVKVYRLNNGFWRVLHGYQESANPERGLHSIDPFSGKDVYIGDRLQMPHLFQSPKEEFIVALPWHGDPEKKSIEIFNADDGKSVKKIAIRDVLPPVQDGKIDVLWNAFPYSDAEGNMRVILITRDPDNDNTINAYDLDWRTGKTEHIGFLPTDYQILTSRDFKRVYAYGFAASESAGPTGIAKDFVVRELVSSRRVVRERLDFADTVASSMIRANNLSVFEDREGTPWLALNRWMYPTIRIVNLETGTSEEYDQMSNHGSAGDYLFENEKGEILYSVRRSSDSDDRVILNTTTRKTSTLEQARVLNRGWVPHQAWTDHDLIGFINVGPGGNAGGLRGLEPVPLLRPQDPIPQFNLFDPSLALGSLKAVFTLDDGRVMGIFNHRETNDHGGLNLVYGLNLVQLYGPPPIFATFGSGG